MSEPDYGTYEQIPDEELDDDPESPAGVDDGAPPLEADPADWQEQHIVVEDFDEGNN